MRAVSALGDQTWTGVGDGTLAVPLGATEQHGPHLPISTDTDLAVRLAEELARRRPGTVVAPPLPYGSSGEHAGFRGTLSIGAEATELLLVELCRSAAESFSRVLLVCAHGGNAVPVRRAERRLFEEGREVRAFFPDWAIDAHAGRAETSLMLALDRSRVKLAAAAPGATEPLAELMPRLAAAGVRSVSSSGVLGDPSGATPEEGRDLIGRAVEELVALADEWPPP